MEAHAISKTFALFPLSEEHLSIVRADELKAYLKELSSARVVVLSFFSAFV
jgi:hypothetical protein